MTQLLMALAFICKVENSRSYMTYIQNAQRQCVAEIWTCIKTSPKKGDYYGACIKPKGKK